MNKYFTKEYIKECDCKEIQGLIPNLKEFDFYIETDTKSKMIQNMSADKWSKIGMVWLPTGDQLDEGIIKICKIGYNYNSSYCKATKTYVAYIEPDYPSKELRCEITHYGNNFLIAKIKLLKELLK